MRVLLIATAFLLSSSALAQNAVTTTTAPTTSRPQPAPAAPESAPTVGESASASASRTATPATASVAPAPVTPSATTLAPIASAAPGSSTFQLVKKTICSDALVKELSAMYTKNRAMFDECAVDADFQIFPNSGKKPTAEQIRAMAVAKSCTAIFTAIVRANFPACDMGGLPIKSVTETLLKIKVDIDEGKESPSAQRFNEMMKWRRDVNLAQEAGVPYDSDSALFREYKVNLWKARASTDVRVSSDFTVEYKLSNGTYTRGALAFSSLENGSNGSSTIGKVKAAAVDSGSQGSSGAKNVESSAVGTSSRTGWSGRAGIAVALLVATSLSSLGLL